jgi:hypothetical protein
VSNITEIHVKIKLFCFVDFIILSFLRLYAIKFYK